MQEIMNKILDNKVFNVLIVFILLDIFLGTIRAMKERKWNSTVGINGILRKIAMIGSIAFLVVVDSIFNFNLVGFIPEEILNYLGDLKVGLNESFSIFFILNEFTSVLKNMSKCGIPGFTKLNNFINKLLTNFTDEIK